MNLQARSHKRDHVTYERLASYFGDDGAFRCVRVDTSGGRALQLFVGVFSKLPIDFYIRFCLHRYGEGYLQPWTRFMAASVTKPKCPTALNRALLCLGRREWGALLYAVGTV